MAASPSISEQDEVRELLSQHRDGIVRELRTSRMIAVLIDTDVMTIKDRLVVCGDDDEDDVGGGAADVNNGGDAKSVPYALDVQCRNLIDFVAQNGFDKFKQFCYAIEAECPQLIADLINDRLKYGKRMAFKVLWEIYRRLPCAIGCNEHSAHTSRI